MEAVAVVFSALLGIAIIGRIIALLMRSGDWFEDAIGKFLFWPWEPR